MQHHFSWFTLFKDLSPIFGDEHFGHVIHLIMVVSVLALCGLYVVARMKRMSEQEKLLPAGKFSLYGVMQFTVEGLTKFVTDIMGHHNVKYTPLMGAVFLIIFISNALGLIPGFQPPTANINTTLALGLFMFGIYNVLGFKENGIGYIKHFFGPMWAIAPLMFVIEMISHMVRPLSLGLRLRGNINGDHMVFSIFSDMIPSTIPNPIIKYLLACFIPVPFLGLGLMVALIQAYVFTLLSMIYLSLATAHDH